MKADLIAARISPLSMNSPSAQFVSSRRMSVYDPIHQINMWGEGFKSNGNLSASIPLIDEADLKFDSSQVNVCKGLFVSLENENAYSAY